MFGKLFSSNSDSRKIERLYVEYRSLLYKVAYRILKDEHAAEDATQLTFVRIMNNLHKIDENNSHETRKYLVVVCSNISIDIYNLRKKEQEIVADLAETLCDEQETVEDIVFSKESLHRLFRLLHSLNPIYREVMLLRFAHNHSNSEIAELLKIDEQTVRKRIERGRKRLLRLLSDENNEGRRNNEQ